MIVIHSDRPAMNPVQHAVIQLERGGKWRSEAAMANERSMKHKQTKQTKPKNSSAGSHADLLNAVAMQALGHLSFHGRQKK